MKKVFISLLFILVSWSANAQIILPVDQILLRDKVKFKDYWITNVTNDTLFDDPNSIPTATSVRAFVEGRIVEGGEALQNLNDVLSEGNWSDLGISLRNSYLYVFDTFGTTGFRAYMDYLQFSKGAGGSLLKWDNITGSRELQLPNASGTIPISINGYTANNSGAVTVPTFYTKPNGSLTDNTNINGWGLDLIFENMGVIKLAAAAIRINAEDSAYISAQNLLINGAIFDNQNNTLRIGTPDDFGYINGGTFSTLIGWRTGEGNAGDFVDAYGTIAGYSNAYNHVGLFGYEAEANKDSMFAISPHYKRIKANGLAGSAGDVLTKNSDGDLVLAPPTGGTGLDSAEAAGYFAQKNHNHFIDSLSNVNTTGKSNGSYLAWNATAEKWEAVNRDSIKVGNGLKVDNSLDTPKLVFNLPPNTMLGNNSKTDSGYNFLKHGEWIDTTLSETLVFTGTTAPSGTVNNRMSVKFDSREVTLYIWLNYSNAGTGITNVSIPLPSWLPLPSVPNDWMSINAWLYTGNGYYGSTRANQSPASVVLKLNSTSTGYEINMSRSSTALGKGMLTLSYLSQ